MGDDHLDRLGGNFSWAEAAEPGKKNDGERRRKE
jgi:hypothetical protein